MDHRKVPGCKKKDVRGILIDKRVEFVIKAGSFLTVKGKTDLLYKRIRFFAHIGAVVAGGGDGRLGRVPQLERIGFESSCPA